MIESEFEKFETYPCFACFSGSDKVRFSPQNSEEKRLISPFKWKNPNEFPPLLDEDSPPHISILHRLGIPYIFDIHAHFFPEVVMNLIWRWFDGVNWEIAYRMPERERISALHKNQILRYTTLNYAHKANMASGLNDWVFAHVGEWQGAVPFGTFFPEPGVLSYVKKAVEKYGFKGFKLHCEVGKFDLNEGELASTFSYLEAKQIPIIIHTGTAPLPGEFTGLKFFKPLMESYPKLKVIVAHMGAHEIFGYAELLKSYQNLALDTTMVFVDFYATGSATDDAIPLLEKFQDRIFFGSDFPNIPYNLSHPVMNLLNLPISDGAKRKILWKNAEILFS